MVSYAIHIAAFASGIGFAGYHKLFGHHFGMHVTTDKMFRKAIEEAYPHITEMLDEVCELGKEEMKSLPSDKLGSWQRAVTTYILKRFGWDQVGQFLPWLHGSVSCTTTGILSCSAGAALVVVVFPLVFVYLGGEKCSLGF